MPSESTPLESKWQRKNYSPIPPGDCWLSVSYRFLWWKNSHPYSCPVVKNSSVVVDKTLIKSKKTKGGAASLHATCMIWVQYGSKLGTSEKCTNSTSKKIANQVLAPWSLHVLNVHPWFTACIPHMCVWFYFAIIGYEYHRLVNYR